MTLRARAKSDSRTDRQLDKLFLQIKEAFSEEYDRGSEDALSKLAFVVGKSGRGGSKRSATVLHIGKSRSPRGAARPFVERALAGGAKSIREIQEAAKSDIEKRLSYQTIRLELHRGKKQKRYSETKNGWLLAQGS